MRIQTREFFVPGKPVAKQRPRVNTKTHVTYTPKRTKDWQRLVTVHYLKDWSGERLITEPICSHIIVQIPMPKSWTKKKKNAMKNEPHVGLGDRDNFEKSVLDALNGVAYEDDRQVFAGYCEKVWVEEERAGVSVKLSYLELEDLLDEADIGNE